MNKHITPWEAQQIFLKAFNTSPAKVHKVLYQYKDILDRVTFSSLIER